MKTLILVLCFLMVCGTIDAQFKWAKYGDTPVLNDGEEGSWDYTNLTMPCVKNIDDTLRMWYSANMVLGEGLYQIGYATSLDGIIWTKYEKNPVISYGELGEWNAASSYLPRVVYDGSDYKMWYAGRRSSTSPVYSIGMASSSDGVNWVEYIGNPVFIPAADSSSWDNKFVVPADVLFDGTEYTLYYTGAGESCPSVGRAFSTDGITWTRDTINNPVIDCGPEGYDKNWLHGIQIIGNDTGGYEFFGRGSAGYGSALGYATSPDGVSWTKYPDNPVLVKSAEPSWDDWSIGWGYTYTTDEMPIYHIWYNGESSQTQGDEAIGYATSLKGFTDLSIRDPYLSPEGSQVIYANFHGDTTGTAFLAVIEDDENPAETVQLFDDGLHEDGVANDSLYANIINTPAGERVYSIGLKVNLDLEEIIHYKDLAAFTSIGPLRAESMSQIEPVDGSVAPDLDIYFKLSLQNTGMIATSENVRALIWAADTLCEVVEGYMISDFPDIKAGATGECDWYFALHTSPNCEIGDSIRFDLKVKHNGVVYWAEEKVLLGIVGVLGTENSVIKFPTSYRLNQNFPNPFNPVTSIRYAIPENTDVNLAIYDVLGGQITQLVNGHKTVGTYEIQWNGKDAQGQEMATGVYFAHLQAGSHSEVIKMLLLK